MQLLIRLTGGMPSQHQYLYKLVQQINYFIKLRSRKRNGRLHTIYCTFIKQSHYIIFSEFGALQILCQPFICLLKIKQSKFMQTKKLYFRFKFLFFTLNIIETVAVIVMGINFT